ncbi:MAG: enoyl-CoA hydratase/isomerase family protein [Actinobacteria bacterium]|nr:MAG: enoyl-CoA hydratase/isomerase family protein [Actinomycetota bacterium]
MSTTTAPTYEAMVRRGREAAHDAVAVERGADRAVVTLHEPERLNALSAAVVRQLRDALEDLAADPAIRAVVLTGADPGFSAGGDLEMMKAAVGRLRDPADEAGTTDIWRWIRYEFGGIVRLIARTDKAFIAAVNGAAAGVGLAFALTCDLVLASERARLVPAFGRLGLLPEVGTSWALTRRLGYQGAFAFYAGGRHLDAGEAQALGLVHEVHPHDDLLAAANAWCDRIAALPPHALAMTKPLLRACADASWDAALALEEFAEPSCFTTRAFADAVEGLRSGQS